MKCAYCGEGIAKVVEEEEEHKGKKYTAIFYRCNKCGEEFYTWGQIEENKARIRGQTMELKEAIKLLKEGVVNSVGNEITGMAESPIEYTQAVNKVLQALEELNQLNEMVEKFPVDTISDDIKFILITKENFLTNPCYKNLLDNYISKDKIKEKIEERKKQLEKTSKRREKAKEQEEQAVLWCLEIRLDERIKAYEALLKGE